MSDLSKILQLFDRIGLPHQRGEVSASFLPEVSIAGGVITYTPDATPGDVLHEAGHIAVTPSPFRKYLTEDIASLNPHFESWIEEHPGAFAHPEDPLGRAILQAGECEAIAWSYAAALEAGINTMTPFSVGFSNKGRSIHLMLSLGQHMGIHGLACGGMTQLPRSGRPVVFPKMTKWLQI